MVGRRACVLAVVVAVLAAGCGGSPAGAKHLAGYGKYHAYSSCMRSSGAPFWPEPTKVNYGVFDSPYGYSVTAGILAQEHGTRWQAALKTCSKLAPSGLPYSAAQLSTLRTNLDKLAACMRSHGFPRFPSPVMNNSGGGFPSTPAGINTNSAAFLAAQRACWPSAPDLK